MTACRGPRISRGCAWGSRAQPVVISGWAPQVHSVFAPQVSALRHLAHHSAQYLNQLHGPGLLGSRPAWWRGHTGATLPPGLSPRSLMPSCLPGPTKHGPSLGNKLTVAYSPAPGPGAHLLSSLTTMAPQCPELSPLVPAWRSRPVRWAKPALRDDSRPSRSHPSGPHAAAMFCPRAVPPPRPHGRAWERPLPPDTTRSPSLFLPLVPGLVTGSRRHPPAWPSAALSAAAAPLESRG